MSTAKPLAITGDITAIKIQPFPPEALQAKSSALAKSREITVITNQDQMEIATSRVSILKGLTKGVEDTRKHLTAPFLAIQKDLMAKAKEFSAELEVETSRLERLISAHVAEENRKAELERHRQERERQEAIRKQQEAERATAQAQRDAEEAERKRLEAIELAANAKTKKQRQEAEAAAEKARQDALAAQEAQDAAAFAEPVEIPKVEEVIERKVSGGTVRAQELVIEITDPVALMIFVASESAGSEPFRRMALLSMVEITPKLKAIKDFLTFHANGKQIPGVASRMETKVSVRAANPIAALEG